MFYTYDCWAQLHFQIDLLNIKNNCTLIFNTKTKTNASQMNKRANLQSSVSISSVFFVFFISHVSSIDPILFCCWFLDIFILIDVDVETIGWQMRMRIDNLWQQVRCCFNFETRIFMHETKNRWVCILHRISLNIRFSTIADALAHAHHMYILKSFGLWFHQRCLYRHVDTVMLI